MTVAWVLSGGAALGSVQVGMALALEEAEATPDRIVGTSVGAVNGAWFAGGGHAVELADVWRALRRDDLFPVSLLQGLRAFRGRSDHFVPDDGLRRTLHRYVPFDRLEDADLPFSVIATEAVSGDEVVLDRGPAVDAIAASAALPAIYPPVEIDGRLLIDGGIVNNTPISTAIDAGATEVWVLSTGYSCGLHDPPATAFAMAQHSISLLVQQRLALETATRTYPVPVRLIPPPCPIEVTPVDFSQTADLIDRARLGTRQWLANGQPDAMPMLAPHQH